MDERVLDDLTEILPPLLRSLEGLGFVARYLNPADFPRVMEAVGAPDAPLPALRRRLEGWPPALAEVRDGVASAADAAIAAFAELRAAPHSDEGVGAVFRALRHLPRAQAALYPMAQGLPPLSRYFLEPDRRDDAALLARLAEAEPRPDTGVLQLAGEAGARASVTAYVPEDYSPDVPCPLVVALHGGSGNGAAFLWSWLRAARAGGAILVCPTAVGRTWALQGPDPDTPMLARIVEAVSDQWAIDPQRRLLTGMSDGGTFAYVSGLEPASPFTHLAPVSAAFHPMLTGFADRERLAGLPIHIVHGALDWMFPVSMAREARDALSAAGAAVTYAELDDLSHTWPREMAPTILAWLKA
jgi:phospholipase/carboxylesterase